MSTIEMLLEKQYGDLHQIIPALVNDVGQVEAATRLGVKQNWLSRWLATNGYSRETVWIRITDKARQALEGVQS
jgi:hypothetical protein